MPPQFELPETEIGPREAAKMLNVSRSQLNSIIDQPLGCKIIKWRWQSEKHGKRLYVKLSVLEYRRAVQTDQD